MEGDSTEMDAQSSMPEDPLACYKLEADSLGLEGEQRLHYIQSRAREDRQAERERIREREKEEKELKLEQEKLKIQQEKEDKDRKFQLEREEAEHKFKLEMRDRERDNPSRENRPTDVPHGGQPKLPYFDGKDNEMDSYLFRFEQYATACGWPQDKWSVYLPSLLKGKALQVYHELSIEQSLSYKDLKEQLLNRFQCTEEGFRTQFRQVRPEQGESMVGFRNRTSHLLTRWVELAKAKTHKELLDLVLREQLLKACSPGLATFLKERKCSSSEEMMKAAENYREAHPGLSMSAKAGDIWSASVSIDSPITREHNEDNPPVRHVGSARTWDARGPGRDYGDRYKRHERQTETETQRYTHNDQTSRTKGVCYFCGILGHKAVQCPKRLGHNAKGVSANSKCSECNATVQVSKTCGHDFDQGASAIVGKSQKFLTKCRGTANGKPVQVMLDTGCTTVGVRKALVKRRQYTGSVRYCRLFSGHLHPFPVARVHLVTPHFKGNVKACVIDNPPCDIILGRIPGVRFTITKNAPGSQDRRPNTDWKTGPCRPNDQRQTTVRETGPCRDQRQRVGQDKRVEPRTVRDRVPNRDSRRAENPQDVNENVNQGAQAMNGLEKTSPDRKYRLSQRGDRGWKRHGRIGSGRFA